MDQSLSSDDLYQPDFPSLGLFSTWFGVVLIGLTAVLQAAHSGQGSYWALPLAQGMKFVLVALILASLFYLPFRAEQGMKWAALPLVINIGTLIIVQGVPFDTVWESARFRWRQGHYEIVVHMVENGELTIGESGTVLLPEAYRYLSPANGRIWVETSEETVAIFFPTERNAPRNFSGYYFRSDNNPPQQGDFLGRWRYVAQKQAHWYFCISE
ncbi:MAG: hypothetical protein H6654_06385 [Ardenticatenaceae bacterium]|nr:hypothetical protein [Anaerolineales bacterium]MCB8942074.1 hypothetical protein [Ardenticatenaceae bacterium]MCB8973166.1 hypothetical protein [Ardenticatenaceae bacterium]